MFLDFCVAPARSQAQPKKTPKAQVQQPQVYSRPAPPPQPMKIEPEPDLSDEVQFKKYFYQV